METVENMTTYRYQNFSIEMDCPPGNPRPDDLIEGVLLDTGLEVSDFETSPPFFGAQIWVLRVEVNKDAIYTSHREEIRLRIVKLYHKGFIRHGSW